MGDLEDAIATGDRRTSLVALREFLAHELNGQRCKSCAMSQLRTGDTAALVLRLTKVMEEIDSLPVDTGELSPLEKLRGGLQLVPPAEEREPKGTKNAKRQQGGRHPKGTRDTG